MPQVLTSTLQGIHACSCSGDSSVPGETPSKSQAIVPGQSGLSRPEELSSQDPLSTALLTFIESGHDTLMQSDPGADRNLQWPPGPPIPNTRVTHALPCCH